MSTVRRSTRLRKLIAETLEDAKGLDIVVLDVRKLCDFTDYMLMATGTSVRHVQSMAERVVEKLRAHGIRPLGMEGLAVGDWVLIDFGDVVVHLMRPETRAFYDLEKLWGEARRIEPKRATAK